MTITQDNYLDLGNLLINELIGSVGLAIIIGLIIIAYWGLKSKTPLEVTMALMFLYTGLVTGYYYQSFLWAISIFVMGAIIYSLIIKQFKR